MASNATPFGLAGGVRRQNQRRASCSFSLISSCEASRVVSPAMDGTITPMHGSPRRRLIRRPELCPRHGCAAKFLHLICVPALEEAISGEWARTAQDECKQTREVEHVDFHAGRAELRARRR